MRLDEHPLQLLYRFLRELGHSSARRMQLIGMKEDLASLFKFVGGLCVIIHSEVSIIITHNFLGHDCVSKTAHILNINIIMLGK